MATIGTDIAFAAGLLQKNELVGIPTETVYGLAGNALDPKAVVKIFSVKNRPSFDPVIVHVASIEKVGALVRAMPEEAIKLAGHFWPGPLTLLLEKAGIIPDLVTAGLPKVGIRCPDHPMTLSLLSRLDFPLAAPSANPFGYVSPTTARHVNDQLGEKIEYILDGGACRVGIESTIVGWEGERPVIYRLGGISREQIEAVTGPAETRLSTSEPQAPGQLRSHYAPAKKILLGDIRELAAQNPSARLATLSFQRAIPGVEARAFILSASGNIDEAARNLFAVLRELDKTDVDLVLAEEVPDTGLGRAINDRLRRAAAR